MWLSGRAASGGLLASYPALPAVTMFVVLATLSVAANDHDAYAHVQVGGMALANGYVAEMATGEGKTLVATLAAYLHALEGRGVHVVTVNEYLANRDANW